MEEQPTGVPKEKRQRTDSGQAVINNAVYGGSVGFNQTSNQQQLANSNQHLVASEHQRRQAMAAAQWSCYSHEWTERARAHADQQNNPGHN